MPPAALVQLQNYPDVFHVVKSTEGRIQHITLSDTLKTFEQRSAKVEEVMQDLRAKDIFISLRGWRDEVC